MMSETELTLLLSIYKVCEMPENYQTFKFHSLKLVLGIQN